MFKNKQVEFAFILTCSVYFLAENDVEYAEFSTSHDIHLHTPTSRVTRHRPWDPDTDPLDEHVMLFHLFEMQDRNSSNNSSTNLTQTNCPWMTPSFMNLACKLHRHFLHNS